TMPVPWNSTYIDLYIDMLRAVRSMIEGMGKHYADQVFLVHIVGPCEGGAETFLPYEDDGSIDPRTGNRHDYPDEWRRAGYSPKVAYDAFKSFIDAYNEIFAGKYLAFDTAPQYLLRNESLDT